MLLNIIKFNCLSHPDMSQAKATCNSQNIYAIVAVMDVRIQNLKPGPGKLREEF